MKNYQPTKRKLNGRLIWIDNNTGRTIIVMAGPFPHLQKRRSELLNNIDWKNGTFKITY